MRLHNPQPRSAATRFVRGRGLEVVLLGYCGWRSADLVNAWTYSPFDRFGWLAFLIWILPLAMRRFGAGEFCFGAEGRKLRFMGLGLALTFLGDIGDLNFSQHAGLLLVLIGFAPCRCVVLWAASAAAWLPASGWVGSRLGVDPTVFALLRVLAAVVGCAAHLYGGSRRASVKNLQHEPASQAAP